MGKILIVDDELDILDAVRDILNTFKYNVATTHKWLDIPELIKDYDPDLILLDVSLGGADGREICKQLKSAEETCHIPVILFSAHYDLINNLKGSEPAAIISKPFEVAHLVETISRSLQ